MFLARNSRFPGNVERSLQDIRIKEHRRNVTKNRISLLKKKEITWWCSKWRGSDWTGDSLFFVAVSRVRAFRYRRHWSVERRGFERKHDSVGKYDRVWEIDFQMIFARRHVASRRLASLRVRRYRCMVPSRILLRPKILSLRLFLSSCPVPRAPATPLSVSPPFTTITPTTDFPFRTQWTAMGSREACEERSNQLGCHDHHKSRLYFRHKDTDVSSLSRPIMDIGGSKIISIKRYVD